MVEVRDAATVMLVRDGDAGMEVLMLMRNLNSDFVGGAYVFPGGAVDPHDRHEDLSPYCLGRNDEEASERLGIESGGLAFWVAAVRECFEEAGILLAYNADGEMVRLDDPAVEARFVSHRAAIDKKERRLIEVCDDEGLKLAVDRIHYFSHWITPEGPPRRYDTRFFVARAPDKQVALHDDRETVANTWIRPQDALDAHERGEFEIIFPTIKNLSAIARFEDADELVAVAAKAVTVPTVVPRIVGEGEQMRILLPGDPGVLMSDPVADYVAAIPSEHRPLFDRVERLIRSVAPDASVRISYGIPTYEVGMRRLYVGSWKHGVSLYGWGPGGGGGFVERHPELKTGKGTIQLSEDSAAALSDDELLTLVRAALG